MKKFDRINPIKLFQLIAELERNVDELVWHCSATVEGKNYSAETIERWHINRKPPFDEIGYNLVLDLKGNLYLGRDWNKIPAHVKGSNSNTLGFCYVGGLDKARNPKDTRTPEQKDTFKYITEIMQVGFDVLKEKQLKVKGHRDYSPDLNGDGIIESWEWTKSCPCFDVQKEIKEWENQA